MDNLTICDRCGSDACYTQEVSPEITNYLCYGCGFISNSLMTEGSEFLAQQVEILPELYKDLMITDQHGKVWMPNMINHPGKGMVFAQGNNRDNWRWTGVKAVPFKVEEKKKYTKPGKKDEHHVYRTDMSTAKYFGEKDFMEALEYIGIFQA
jgi:hypothetical protein